MREAYVAIGQYDDFADTGGTLKAEPGGRVELYGS